MKKFGIELKVTDIENEISATQKTAGGLPTISKYPSMVTIEGETDEEILNKIIVNVFATYCKAASINDKDFIPYLSKINTLYKQILQNSEDLNSKV